MYNKREREEIEIVVIIVFYFFFFENWPKKFLKIIYLDTFINMYI